MPSLLNKDLSKSEGDLQASLPITLYICNAEKIQSVRFADPISASEGDNPLPPQLSVASNSLPPHLSVAPDPMIPLQSGDNVGFPPPQSAGENIPPSHSEGDIIMPPSQL